MSEEKQFDLLKYRPEDGGILDAWLDLWGDDWLYVTGYEAWYKWTGTHWEKDECQAILKQIQHLMDAMNQAAKTEAQAAKAARDEEAEKVWRCYIQATKRTRGRIASVEGMAQAQRATAAGMLDAGNVLNLRNGTLELDTITLRPHCKGDHLTYCLVYDYDPQAVAPRFEQFLFEVLVQETADNSGQWATDWELCALIQAAMGYSLTNDTRHHAMFWLSGTGQNGKSVLISVIQSLLGVNAFSMNFATLGTTDGNYRLAELAGKRVVFCTESQRGGGLAEELIKQIADGSRIDARPIYGKPLQFNSQAKIWWAMNDRPVIKDTSNAIWRRLKLIPFNRTFSEQEKDIELPEKLNKELPGILNFALDGLRRLRQQGRLPESRAIQEAIEEYRKESNPVAQWVEDCTKPTQEPETLASTLYSQAMFNSQDPNPLSYVGWCKRVGRQALNATNFGKELKRLGIANRRVTAGVIYAISLRETM